MGLFDWRSGTRGEPAPEPSREDERAVERYRYMLKTAPPEAIEEAHAQAFAALTPEQRRIVLERLAENAPAAERRQIEQAGADPNALARAATRAEVRQPGMLERVFGGTAASGFGSMMAGSLLGTVAGTVLGSMIAREFFAHDPHGGDLAGRGRDGGDSHDAAADASDVDPGSDFDTGDLGGDFDAGTFDV